MRIGTIDVDKLRGVAGKGIGLAKEMVGTLTGNDRLVEAGEAQQERATHELKALRKQVEAERHEAEAELHEQRQRVAAKAKSARS